VRADAHTSIHIAPPPAGLAAVYESGSKTAVKSTIIEAPNTRYTDNIYYPGKQYEFFIFARYALTVRQRVTDKPSGGGGPPPGGGGAPLCTVQGAAGGGGGALYSAGGGASADY
jgi:hypothetical protein